LVPLKFLDDMMRLKLVPRSGWISYRISKHDVESVSSHSYSVAVIALTLSEMIRLRTSGIDVEQVLRMALLHDLSEALTFDISKAYLRYLGRRGSQLKTQLERKAISRILTGLENPRLVRTFMAALNDYSSAKTVEARVVHCADALDLLLQIVEYERMGYPKTTLDPIWNETRSKLMGYRLPLASGWLRGLERVRKQLHTKRRGTKPRFASVK
jgi:putative hydrolase of HD superfamily